MSLLKSMSFVSHSICIKLNAILFSNRRQRNLMAQGIGISQEAAVFRRRAGGDSVPDRIYSIRCQATPPSPSFADWSTQGPASYPPPRHRRFCTSDLTTQTRPGYRNWLAKVTTEPSHRGSRGVRRLYPARILLSLWKSKARLSLKKQPSAA